MLLLRLRPNGLVETTTTRAVTVSARMVRIVVAAAPIAHGVVSAKTTGATADDVSRNLPLLMRQLQGSYVIAQHIGDAECDAFAVMHVSSRAAWS